MAAHDGRPHSLGTGKGPVSAAAPAQFAAAPAPKNPGQRFNRPPGGGGSRRRRHTIPGGNVNVVEDSVDTISGLIERVTFHNEESGFCVLRVKVQGRRELLTVVGNIPAVSEGEWLTAQGRWARDREHGMQLRSEWIKLATPESPEGIERYLGSGLIRGIGPVYAKKLVAQFGGKIFDIIDNHSARLEEVPGIGTERRKSIKAAWNEQRAIREIMVFLHSHGVGTSRATRIYKRYGEAAIETVQADPYRLSRDMPGIGFKTADMIAEKLGIPKDSLLRAAGGLNHILASATEQGHAALPLELLLDQTAQLLDLDPSFPQQALERALQQKQLVQEKIGGTELIYLPVMNHAERVIAERIRDFADRPSTYPMIDVQRAITWVQEKTGKQLAPSQRIALEQALKNRLLVITGGPGVGKTTLVQSILMVLCAKKVRVLLCAPTGRAAKRLGESTGLPAKTIHRLLEVQSGSFLRDEKNPLECDLLVVDETSMVDIPLMSRLLRALPRRAHLLMVGDVDQLPSVGPGTVLADLINSGVVPVVRLTEIFRQAAASRIVTNAHKVNEGEMPETGTEGEDSDFFFVTRDDTDAIVKALLQTVAKRAPTKIHGDPIRDVQVLCPMNRSSLGAKELNARLQYVLNPPSLHKPEVERFGWRFRQGDKVIQTSNNYDKEVFNGDIGMITAVDTEERQVKVQMDQREVIYEFGEMDELSLAYAITIHKSQGSEFPAVVIPISTQQFVLLQRNLIYTGITRGKKLVVLIGQPRAMALAVRNAEGSKRFSGLLARLQQGHSMSGVPSSDGDVMMA